MIWQTWVRIIELHCVNYLFDDDVGIRLTGRKSASYSMKQAWKLGSLACLSTKVLAVPWLSTNLVIFFFPNFVQTPLARARGLGVPGKKKGRQPT